jgi:rod shape determining protein RodA
MRNQNQNINLHKGIDGWLILMYILMVAIGILSITAVEYRPCENLMKTFFEFKKNYSKQLLFFGISAAFAIFILLTDSKLFTLTANLQYATGIVLMLLVFVIGSKVKGTESIIKLGGFQFQPAELCKLFTALCLAKYFSRPEVDFQQKKHQFIVMCIALTPAVLSIAQKETGVALVYFSFFLMMYREGLPSMYLILGFSFVALVLTSLVFADKPYVYMAIIGVIAAICIYILRKQIKRKRNILILILAISAGCIGFQKLAMPLIFTKVLKGYQSTRIFTTLGMENPYATSEKSDEKKSGEEYNVKQSKIAIGNGEFFGKGYMKGTITSGNFVPEQSTDFIFCTIGENFGFVGSFVYLLLYALFLFRITVIAERQRSTFSRVYAYCVASIFFFHIVINIGMVTGIMPVIGIPLPFVSYGGTSLISFTVMLFVLLRLDADRQMVLR